MDGTSNLPLRAATKRHHETLDGMFDTFNRRCKLITMKDYVLSNDKFKDRVVSNVYRGNVRSFENSPQMLREVLLQQWCNG